MILEILFSIALFITGGHLMDTKLGLHHYSDEDYKEIFYLKNKNSISKNCIRHSKLEDIKKMKSHHNGESRTIYKVTKNGAVEVRISSGDTPTHPTFGAPSYLYVICHAHTKQVKKGSLIGQKVDLGVNWRDEEF